MKKIKITFEDDLASELCHNFWNEAPDHLLMEIFIRHPDCRSAARTSTVCRHWHSLISRKCNPQFIERFNSHHRQHQDRYPTEFLPWTIMFRKTDIYHDRSIPQPQHFRNNCQLYSDEWMFLHGKSLLADCLDFMPSPMLIRASCNDLLLVSPGISYTDDLYICNPVTKQFVQLPAVPRLANPRIFYEGGRIGYALVPHMPPSGAATNSQFKVVQVFRPQDHLNFRRLRVLVFCSESGKWEIRRFSYVPRRKDYWRTFIPDTYYSNIIRCNEILFWLGTSWESDSIGYLDLSKNKYGFIDIPEPRGRDMSCDIGIVHVSGGVQELRMIQVIQIRSKHIKWKVQLKVWRLNNNRNNNGTADWFLVHDTRVERPKDVTKVPRGMCVHPTNGDLVFLVWDKIVVEYNLINNTNKKIAELLDKAVRFTLTPFLWCFRQTPSEIRNGGVW